MTLNQEKENISEFQQWPYLVGLASLEAPPPRQQWRCRRHCPRSPPRWQAWAESPEVSPFWSWAKPWPRPLSTRSQEESPSFRNRPLQPEK